MSDPNATGGVSATLKTPPTEQYGNDGAWLVFHGSVERVREDVIAALGMEVDDSTPLADIVIEAAVQFKATNTAARTAGGKTLGRKASGSKATTSDTPAEDGPPWKTDEAPADPEPEGNPLLGQIENAGSIKELQNIYADNKADIVGEVLDAWKAKGKALKNA